MRDEASALSLITVARYADDTKKKTPIGNAEKKRVKKHSEQIKQKDENNHRSARRCCHNRMYYARQACMTIFGDLRIVGIHHTECMRVYVARHIEPTHTQRHSNVT